MPERDVPAKYICSITQQVMCDPVVTADGHVYEREAIEGWLLKKQTSPNTNLVLESKNLVPVICLKQMIKEFLENNPHLHSQGRVYVPKAQKSELHRKLFKAIQANKTNTVQAILKEGVDVESCAEDGKTPLILSVEHDRLDVVKLLLQENACVGVRSAQDEAPLHIVAKNKSPVAVKIAKVLLEAKASINSTSGETRRTPLSIAARYDNESMVKLFLKKKADVHLTSDSGQTALHMACMDGSLTAAKLLVEAKSKLEALTDNDETPLHLATAFNRVRTVEMLYKSGANIEATNHIGNPLHYAISEQYPDLTRMILKWKINIEARDRDGDAPLALAAMKGYALGVRLLLDAKANIVAKSKEDRTALHHAASQGHLDLVTELLDCGAPINAQTIYGQTPLNRACVKGRLEVMKLLIEKKADFELADRWGATPLYRAARNNKQFIVRHLISVGANIDTSIHESHNGDEKGNTALHTSAWRGHIQVVETLLNHHADYTIKNARGLSAADISDKPAVVAKIQEFQDKEQKSCPILVRRMQHMVSVLEKRISALESSMNKKRTSSKRSWQGVSRSLNKRARKDKDP